MDLVIGTPYEGFGGTWAEVLRQLIEPFEASPRCVRVTTSRFVWAVSTVSIKAAGERW
jgi:hypothetical protein